MRNRGGPGCGIGQSSREKVKIMIVHRGRRAVVENVISFL